MTRNDIEYFITECGDPTVPVCIASVEAEVKPEFVQIISNNKSAYSAFNEMIDRSTKKYGFQIDGDQKMYPGFVDRVEKVAEKIMDKNHNMPMVLFSSYDSFEERNIWASCKLYNMECFRRTGVRFKDMKGCDRQVLKDLRSKGCCQYKAIEINNPIATHDLRGCGAPFVFSRFQNRVAKDGLGSVRGFLGRWKNKWNNERDFCSAAALLACVTPYKHSGEVSREAQKTYHERQIFESPEDHLEEIKEKVNKALKQLKI